MAFYVLDDNNNRVEAFDKEGVLAAIEEAIRNGSLANLVADAAFISKLKCCVTGATNKMGFITQAKYNELKANGLLDNNTYYFIYDDNTVDNMETQLAELSSLLNNTRDTLQKIGDGSIAVPLADYARVAAKLQPKEISLDYAYKIENMYYDYPYYALNYAGAYLFSINEGTTINSDSLYVGTTQKVDVKETISSVFDLTKDLENAQAFTCGKYKFMYLPNGGYVNHSTYGKITYPSNSLVLLDTNYTSFLKTSGKLVLLTSD